MLQNWEEVKAFALALDLPHVAEATSWGNEVLKAHGKLWTWWSPYLPAALFKCDKDEGDMLRAADPETFLFHKHYAKHNLILVAGGRIDEGWAEARLIRTWRDLAPKRVLKDWDAAQNASKSIGT